jgi:hypothetical protein
VTFPGMALAIEIKLSRFQLATVGTACLALAGASVFLVWQFHAIGLPPACTSVYEYPPGLVCPSETLNEWVRTTQKAEAIPPLLAFLPWVAGILLGVPAVGNEIETGTAVLAWTLGPSRRHWLFRRVAVLLALMLAFLAIPATAAVLLYGTEKPLIDPLATFDQYGSRGLLVVARGTLAFAIAVLVGAWTGRFLPGLVLAVMVCVTAMLAFQALFPHLMPPVELTQPTGTAGEPAPISYGYRLDDGRIVSWTEAVAAAPPRGTPEYDQWELGLEPVVFGYPASSAFEISFRESVLTVGSAAGALAGAVILVQRRRPY